MAENLPQQALRALDEFGHLGDMEAAQRAGIGRSAVQIMRASINRAPYVRRRINEGRLDTMHAVGRAAGLPSVVNRQDARVGFGEEKTYIGKGDKFNEATSLLRRYLGVWGQKGFAFPHVAPKEARRRVEIIDGLLRDLEAARVDLVSRSDNATLTYNGKKGSK